MIKGGRRYLVQTIIALAPAALVAGCSGAGGEGASEFSPLPEAPELSERLISGSVTGLNGNVTLNWLGNSEMLSPGAFTVYPAFDNDNPAQTSFTLTLSDDPLGQRCRIDSQTSFVDQTEDVTGVAIHCEEQNVVLVSGENFFTGDAMNAMSFSAGWDDGSGRQTVTETLDAAGEFELELPTFDGRVVINADSVGFGEQSVIVYNTATAGSRVARLLMQTRNAAATFDAAAGASLLVGGEAFVTIPGGALVDGSGTPYSGAVTAELTLIDPSVDAALLPGDYLSRDGGGLVQPLESFGAISVTLFGDAGQALDLAAGQTATINIPVAAAALAGAPASLPLYWYDDVDGYHVQEGTGTLTTLGSGTQAYSAAVDHFTVWGAHRAFDPVNVTGCVVNPANTPLPNVRVNATGVDYIGTSSAITDAARNFSIAVKPNASVLLAAGDGLQSRTVQVATGNADNSVDECIEASAGSSTITLTWGTNPSDLDTHLHGISAVDSGDDFHIDYTNRNVTVAGLELFLDVDDVTSFGPEIVTIPEFPFEGTYRYGVHLFAGSGDIATSPARVELNLAGETSVFIPPPGTPTDCWAVFDITVNAMGAATLTTLNSWEPEAWCTSGSFGGVTINSGAVAPALTVDKGRSPLTRAIEDKYYR